MNRDLFKAKRKSWKELPKEEWWVEGYLFDDGMPEPKHYFIGGIIVNPYEGTACDKWNVVGIDFYEIDINTLCQYTGLTDKNGKKIWENDLLGHKLNRVEFLNGTYCINGDRSLFFEANTNEVIGNIFDNQEMLEVE